MKTAWEILNELLLPDMESCFKDKNGDGYVDISLHTFNMAMKLNAEQALDLAAEKALISHIGKADGNHVSFWGEVDKESILKLKEQLK